MRKIISGFIIISLLIIMGVQIISLTHENNDSDITEINNSESLPEDIYANIFKDKYLIKDSLIVSDYKGDIIQLDLKKDSNIYIVRIFGNGCKPCESDLMKSLNEFSLRKRGKRIIILMDGIPKRDLYVNSKNLKDRYEIYNLKNLITDITDVYNPYILEINSDYRINQYFMVAYDQHQRTSDFFDDLSNDEKEE